MKNILIGVLVVCCCNVWGQKVIEEGDYKGRVFDTIVNFRRTEFESDADFEGAKFKSDADFWRTEFESLANFSFAKFKSKADFGFAEFNLKADFGGSRFESDANFEGAIFHPDANFWNAKFDSKVNFSDAVFNSNAIFYRVEFDSVANFSNTKFDSVAIFSNTIFHSKADFRGTNFSSTVFHNTIFDSKADFSSSTFNSKTLFTDVTFYKRVNSSSISIHAKTFFIDITLPDTLIFSNVIINGPDIDFTYAKLDSSKNICHINITRTDIHKLIIPFDRFTLLFDTITSIEIKKSTYQKLLKKAKEVGYEDSYEMLDKEYKEFKYETKGQNWLNWLDKFWWDYGYTKTLIFRNSIIILAFFSLITFMIFNTFRRKVYVLEELNKAYDKIQDNSKWIVRVLSKILFSIHYTSIIFFGLKFSFDKFKHQDLVRIQPNKLLLLIYFLSIYVSGLVCLGFMANLILG